MRRTGLFGGALALGILRIVAPTPAASGASAEPEHDVKLERDFTPEFLASLEGKTVIDFGCGDGLQAVTLAHRIPGCRIIGLDIQPRMLRRAARRAREAGVADRCVFAQSTHERADVILSIDAFEHFDDPATILESMSQLLKPDGEVMVSFGPTWLHPYGGHLFSVFPWAHLIFSERALIRWRAQFRSDGARSFCEVEGGLNQILISEFERLVERSALRVDWLETVPIRQWSVFRYRPLREFGSSIVRCRLIHEGHAAIKEPSLTGELAT
jgi:SAM-dependent methyltransferase